MGGNDAYCCSQFILQRSNSWWQSSVPSVDSNLKRSSASELTFTDAESGKRSCYKRNQKDEKSPLKATILEDVIYIKSLQWHGEGWPIHLKPFSLSKELLSSALVAAKSNSNFPVWDNQGIGYRQNIEQLSMKNIQIYYQSPSCFAEAERLGLPSLHFGLILQSDSYLNYQNIKRNIQKTDKNAKYEKWNYKKKNLSSLKWNRRQDLFERLCECSEKIWMRNGSCEAYWLELEILPWRAAP